MAGEEVHGPGTERDGTGRLDKIVNSARIYALCRFVVARCVSLSRLAHFSFYALTRSVSRNDAVRSL
jgi:hypothetical protein